MATILDHISKVVLEHGGMDKVAFHAVKARMNGKVLTDSKRLDSVDTILHLAVEHLLQTSSDLIVEDLTGLNELELPSLEIGDTLLVGKFKNRRAEITGFDTDDKGQPIGLIRAVDDKDLPVDLPPLDDYKPHGRPERVDAPGFDPLPQRDGRDDL